MKIKTKLVIYFTTVIFLGVFSAGVFYYLVVKPSQIVLDAGEKIANGVADAFNFTPQVSVKNTVIFEEHAAILEVAVLSQRIVHDYEYSNTWIGSTKELHLRGVYLAKYGFDLKKQDFMIHISEDDSSTDQTYNLTFNIPDPLLLSFETENYRVIEDRDGWWNQFDEIERETAVNTMRNEARRKALSMGYRNKVRDSLESQLKLMVETLPLDIQIGAIQFLWQGLNMNLTIEHDSLMLKNAE